MIINHQRSIPLHFARRYFLLETNKQKLLNVILKDRDKWIYEIKKNLPIENPISYTHKIPIEEIAASDKINGKIIYKINLGPVIKIRVFLSDENEHIIKIDGDRIMIGNRYAQNHSNVHVINVAINLDGSFSENLSIPDELSEFLEQC